MSVTVTLHAQRDSTFPFSQRDILSRPAADTLRLEELFAAINANHPKLRAAILGVERADASVMRAWGTLDPQLRSQYNVKQQDGKFKNNEFGGDLTVPIYWGPKVVAGFRRNLGFFDQDVLTPESGELSVALQVPLWRNIMIDKNRASIQKAEALQPGAQANLTEQRNELFLKSSEKYWDWSAAYQKFRIAQQLLTIAEFRFESIKQEVQRGERAIIDSVEAYQEIQRRLGSYVKSRRDVEKAIIAVSIFLWNADGTSAAIPIAIAPASLPAPQLLNFNQYGADKSNALLFRPELLELNAEYDAAGVDVRFANEQWKPEVNVKFAPFSQQFSQGLGGQTGLNYKLGIDFALPLIQRDARGQFALADIKQREVDLKRRLMQRDVEADVDDAASEVIAAYEQAQAAQLERAAAVTMEQSERELFTRGESNLFTVNIRERASAEAQQREVDALATFHKAAARYRWATARF
ncbi:MAG: TolC family protein [Candidatus Kapabacteria bacterium]|nr:TolC family protein [Candidatus Kapabacteria bacterium]